VKDVRDQSKRAGSGRRKRRKRLEEPTENKLYVVKPIIIPGYMPEHRAQMWIFQENIDAL
jgi:hypothetical protein